MSSTAGIECLLHPAAQAIIDEFQRRYHALTVDTLVVILRGMPGSGKSTFATLMALYANSLRLETRMCSADMFFERDHGYVFDAGLIGAAHEQCFRRFECAVSDYVPVVIVDNTNIGRREWGPYEGHVAAENRSRSWDIDYDSINVVKVQFECSDLETAYRLNNRGKRIPDHVIERRFGLFLQDNPLFEPIYSVRPRYSA